MNILGKIREAKADFSQKQNMKAAENLQILKKKREREEGKANLIKLQNKERDRIKEARQVRFNDVRRKFGVPEPIQTSKAVPKKKKMKKRTSLMPEKKEEKKRAFGEGINPAFGFK